MTTNILTIKIVRSDLDSGYAVINEADFDRETMKIYEEDKVQAPGKKKSSDEKKAEGE